MGAVVAALLFMYAYGTDDQVVKSFSEEYLSGVSKNTIFYSGLAVFGVFNFLMVWGIKTYREAKGFDPGSRFFKNEMHKGRILFWITLLLASANFMMGLIITYIGFIKIEGIFAQAGYIHLPIIGVGLFAVALVGLIASILSKK